MSRLERVTGARLRVPVYWGEVGTRSVSDVVRHGRLELPALPADVAQNWTECLEPHLREPGDISAATKARKDWPQGEVAQRVACWATEQGLDPGLDPQMFSVLGCMGAPFHDDTHGFADQGFCVVWMSPDACLDLYFPHIGKRIALEYGTVVMFDACQPHGVVERRARTWTKADKYYRHRTQHTQHFLSWDFDLQDLQGCPLVFERFKEQTEDQESSWPFLDGRRVQVQSRTGAWIPL